ncbi:MB21D2-like [Lucilia cuprina]|nr:MB21D2-like [Lucilia cuprina]
MGRSSSKPLQKPNNPLQEIQYKESLRERTRQQQEKEKKQIAILQKKQAKKLGKTKRKRSASNEQTQEQQAASSATIRQRGSADTTEIQTNFNYHTMRYDFRREDLNRQLETKIQKLLNEDLCEFILNQMALSIQFFKNYESELSAIADEKLNKEKQLNQNLEEHSILLTNPLDMAIAKWVKYKPCHGPDKNNVQLLQPQTIYVVFENIDIARPNDANYDSISPLCKVDLELDFRESTPCKEDYVQMLSNIKWKGYVRLKLREDPKQAKTLTGDFEDIYSEGSSGYGTTSPYSSKTVLNTYDNDKEEDYDYAFISHLNTQHPLRELKMSNAREQHRIDAKVLPESCISSLGNFVQPLQEEEFTDDEEDSDSEYENGDGCEIVEDYRDYDTLQAIKLYRIELEKRRKLLAQNYLNSREFMKYFGELVRKKLAEKLNISELELNESTYRGTSIYTNKYELIPAIYAAQNVSDWPKCAFEFRLRDRPISTNPQTGQQIQWPTRAMIKRIETFGFHVIPMGYAPKKKRNPFRDIEWRIVFPKAERYLEQHLSNAQVKVYMISKALIKSFVEPIEKNKSLMFALDHLRMHLFWECERDYTAWPEEFLGEVLLRFLNSFKQRVKEKQLSDYFIRERNLFESIPEYSLNSLYTILADITTNPVMHLMIAFRNLEFTDDFIPKLNFKKLYENLVENDMVKLKMLAKNARSLIDLAQEEEDNSCLMPDEGAKGLLGLKQHHVRTNGKLRRKTHLLRHNIEMKKQEMQAKRRSVESIDVEFFFKRNIKSANTRQLNQGVENLRRTNILEIILDHLLEMAAKAIQFQSVVMAKISYLSQARRLCKCYHNYGCDIGAKEYLASIHNLDEELQIIYDKEDFSIGPPSLPRRISMEPVLPEVPQTMETNSFNVYEEMIPQDKLATATPEPKKCLKFHMEGMLERSEPTSPERSPEPRKSIKFRNVVVEVQPGDINPLHAMPVGEAEIKTCLKTSHKATSLPENIGPVKSPEPRKSIKFRDKVITVHQGDLNPIQKPQGYSPVSILRSKNESKEIENNNSENEDDRDDIEDLNEEEEKLTSTDKQSLIPSYLRSKLKSSSDFIKSSPIGNTEIFQNISQNTNHFLNNMSAEEKKAHIREMLKRKTLQLKGVFNQSSDT